MKLDLIEYTVISQAIVAAAREMGAKLVRSAYSTIVREARDASTAILDAQGNIVSQAEMIPIQLGSMGTTLRACLEHYPTETLEEGDFLVNNHPYHGGQHLQDVFIFTPIFFEGQFIAFTGSTAHHLDLGGGGAGLNNAATDLYQEGLIIPPTKYNMKRDWFGGGFERLLAANIRVPDQTLGDFNAQFAANAIGGTRMQQLCAKYGVEKVRQAMTELMDYAERHLRTAIAAIPDGVYYGEDALDDDGVGDTPVFIRSRVTIKGDEIEVDFDGTCPQSVKNINAPIASTVSAVMCCIKSVVIGSDIPFNEGSFRPVTIKVPLGSILNPRPPAPVRARMEPCYRAYGSIMKAFAQATPDRAISAGFDAALITCLSRFADERFRVCLETYGGGFGASRNLDGADGIAAPLSNTTNSPVEALDMEFDFFRIVGYRLAPNSFGHGRQRGGLGLRRTYEILKDDVDFSVYADRFRVRPEGLEGGTRADLSRCEIFRDGVKLDVDAKKGIRLRKGDQVVISTSGGAGFGDPAARARDAVKHDLAHDFITPDEARRVYGLQA